MPERSRAFVHGHTFLHSWSGLRALVPSRFSYCTELRSCPILLLFSFLFLYDLSSWKGYILNPKYNNNLCSDKYTIEPSFFKTTLGIHLHPFEGWHLVHDYERWESKDIVQTQEAPSKVLLSSPPEWSQPKQCLKITVVTLMCMTSQKLLQIRFYFNILFSWC